MQLLPFAALRPATNELALRIASLPYDVMDTAEARVMAAGNPDCFLHVVRSEIDLPDDCDPHADIVYQAARKALDALVADGRLKPDRERTLYVYRQRMGTHSQTAVVACCRIDDYAHNVILKHEKTRKDKEDDRTAHILATDANTGQVFLTYAGRSEIDALVAAETATTPLYDFTAVDGIGHSVWKVAKTDALRAAFEAVPRAYIADGHHRSAASYRAGMARRQSNPNHRGQEEYDGFMACLFPAAQLRILPYNRLIVSLNGLTPDQFLAEVSKRFALSPVTTTTPTASRSSHLYIAGQWYRLAWTVAADASPVAKLDVSVLQDRLFAPLLGIVDPRTDSRIAFVGGIRGTDELVRKVDAGHAAAAFSMCPTTVAEMMAIADAGEIMPPKSTWFEPKLRSGLLIHRLT